MITFPYPETTDNKDTGLNAVFHRHRTETEMMRYIFRLQRKDLSLADSMIALGSCTMKLNAATAMLPVTWPEFANMHPFAPREQAAGGIHADNKDTPLD